MSAGALQPVSTGERVPLFDVLRGFALLGILLVNFWGPIGEAMPRVDAFVDETLDLLIAGSFYPLYSFLFGLGFAVQLASARARGRRAGVLYLRRLLALFLIGTFHAVLIWNGDILVTYAVLGLLLVPCHRLPQWAVLALAVGIFVAQMNVQAINAWRNENRSPRAELLEGARLEAEAILNNEFRLSSDIGSASASTSFTSAYGTEVANRWGAYTVRIRDFADPWSYLLNDIVIYFLIGLAVGRARILHDPKRWRWLLATGVALGVVAAVASYVAEPTPGFWQNITNRAYNNSYTVIYVAGIALLYTYSARAGRALDIFAAPGRLGLTNYLMQSIVMTLLYTSYGLGWMPTTTVWVVINLAFFFGVQVPFSRWWIARYRFGPAEWLWRSLTYGQAQPFRLTAPSSVAPPAVLTAH